MPSNSESIAQRLHGELDGLISQVRQVEGSQPERLGLVTDSSCAQPPEKKPAFTAVATLLDELSTRPIVTRTVCPVWASPRLTLTAESGALGRVSAGCWPTSGKRRGAGSTEPGAGGVRSAAGGPLSGPTVSCRSAGAADDAPGPSSLAGAIAGGGTRGRCGFSPGPTPVLPSPAFPPFAEATVAPAPF